MFVEASILECGKDPRIIDAALIRSPSSATFFQNIVIPTDNLSLGEISIQLSSELRRINGRGPKSLKLHYVRVSDIEKFESFRIRYAIDVQTECNKLRHWISPPNENELPTGDEVARLRSAT